ncbi:hypothetical protein CBR_g57709 [Chara braunii]|uniref:EF-hand domain-containing protein n=1 Tax=Chara braunii TaxID=69332 RepID=A0A388MEI7_CHABU|nr:hypothetical protein CBR_g57709 [Chara braunii]|eukprot:GBG92905.1 hypothetical protein CBR_g57709 [Chara braunii]
MATLTEKQVADFKEAFSLFDRDRDGSISTKEVGTVMRALGLNPTEADLSDMVKMYGDQGKTALNCDDFLDLMSKNLKEQSEDDLKSAFRVFDKDNDGLIAADELRHIMTSLGEVLSAEEVDEMMKEADGKGTGQIQYEDFVKIMMQR